MNPIEVQVSGGQGIVPSTYKTIVLKPNIVNGKNMLTQAMFAQTDTKYVIKYDYIVDDDIVVGNVQVLSTNVSQCVNPAYTEALAAYNEAHDAWIDADNAYTNNPNDTTLAAKNAAYAAYNAAQITLNNTPQYYYYAAKAISLHKGQHIIIPDTCVLLNSSLNALAGFEVAPVDSVVYIGSLIPETYGYTVQEAIQVPARCLIEFDGGSISDGTLIGNETVLVYDQEEEVVLKNVTLLGVFELPAKNTADKKDNTDGMAKIYLKNNRSFAEQVDVTHEGKPNTIYVIQYDFTLDDDVTIPVNCVLDFDGGSIGGEYTIIGQNTGIKVGLVKIFDADVTLAGTWNVAEAYPEWFGAKDNGETDDTIAIQKTLDAFDTIKLVNDYKISFINVPDDKTIKSDTFNTVYTSGGIVLGQRCSVIAPSLTIQSISTEGIDILKVGSKNTIWLYAIIGKQPSTTEYGSNTTDNGLVCEYIIFSKIRLHRIQYCNHGIQLKAGDQQTGDTLNKVEIDVTWIADCLYGIHQNSTGSAENAFINAYIEYCNVGWYVKDMFIGVHNIHFDDVNTWFEVAAGHALALGILNLTSIKYTTFLEKMADVALLETHINLKDGYWYRPLKAANGGSMQTSKRVDGLCIYRTDVRKPVWWDNGTQQWVDADGNYYNSSKADSTAGRPNSRTTSGSTTIINFTVGYMYYDTDLKKPIWFAGRDGDNDVWKDATGATV